MQVKTFQSWPDSICCCISGKGILMETPDRLEKWEYGVAEVQIDLNLDEVKSLIFQLQNHVANYEELDLLAEKGGVICNY